VAVRVGHVGNFGIGAEKGKSVNKNYWGSEDDILNELTGEELKHAHDTGECKGPSRCDYCQIDEHRTD
jgi:hypothetical protein